MAVKVDTGSRIGADVIGTTITPIDDTILVAKQNYLAYDSTLTHVEYADIPASWYIVYQWPDDTYTDRPGDYIIYQQSSAIGRLKPIWRGQGWIDGRYYYVFQHSMENTEDTNRNGSYFIVTGGTIETNPYAQQPNGFTIRGRWISWTKGNLDNITIGDITTLNLVQGQDRAGDIKLYDVFANAGVFQEKLEETYLDTTFNVSDTNTMGVGVEMQYTTTIRDGDKIQSITKSFKGCFSCEQNGKYQVQVAPFDRYYLQPRDNTQKFYYHQKIDNKILAQFDWYGKVAGHDDTFLKNITLDMFDQFTGTPNDNTTGLTFDTLNLSFNQHPVRFVEELNYIIPKALTTVAIAAALYGKSYNNPPLLRTDWYEHNKNELVYTDGKKIPLNQIVSNTALNTYSAKWKTKDKEIIEFDEAHSIWETTYVSLNITHTLGLDAQHFYQSNETTVALIDWSNESWRDYTVMFNALDINQWCEVLYINSFVHSKPITLVGLMPNDKNGVFVNAAKAYKYYTQACERIGVSQYPFVYADTPPEQLNCRYFMIGDNDLHLFLYQPENEDWVFPDWPTTRKIGCNFEAPKGSLLETAQANFTDIHDKTKKYYLERAASVASLAKKGIEYAFSNGVASTTTTSIWTDYTLWDTDKHTWNITRYGICYPSTDRSTDSGLNTDTYQDITIKIEHQCTILTSDTNLNYITIFDVPATGKIWAQMMDAAMKEVINNAN